MDSPDKGISFGFLVLTAGLAFMLVGLDVSIVNVAVIPIAKTFRTTIQTLQWVIDVYTLSFSVLLLAAGNLSDSFGARKILQSGLIVFGIASVGCGMAVNPLWLILFRIGQGIGAAAMIPSSLAILNHSLAHEPVLRTRAISLWTASGSAAIAIGPVLGGLLIQYTSWRWIFYINLPLCILGLAMSLKIPQSHHTVRKKFDIVGQILWVLSVLPMITAIIEWPKLGIQNPLIYGSLLGSVVMLIAFLFFEKKVSSPMLPLHMFRFPSFNVLLLLGAVFNSAYYGTVFILSLYLQGVLHYSALAAGLAFIPLTIGFVLSNLVSAKVINRYGIRGPVMAGLLTFCAGFSGLFVCNTETAYIVLFLPFLIIPLGMGLAVPAMTNGILSSVDKSLSGTASAALNTIRQTAGAIGVALLGSLSAGGSVAIVGAIHTGATLTILCCLLVLGLCFKYLKQKPGF